MFLGIEKLDVSYSSLELSGLFVLTVPSFSFAKSLLVQTIIQNPQTKTALISFEERSQEFNVTPQIQEQLAQIYQDGNLFLNAIYLHGDERRALSNIKSDIEKPIFDEIELILIEFDQNSFSFVPEKALNAVLSIWQSWLKKQNKTCVWVIHGDMSATLLRNKFVAVNNAYNGYTNIEFDVSEIKYELIFWHLKHGVQSDVLRSLNFHEAENTLSVAENTIAGLQNTLTLSQSKNNRVFVIKPKDDSTDVFPREWEILLTLEELAIDVISNSAATIVIYINSSLNVSDMAEKILQLRKAGGAQLKIMLRETEQCLRNIEEKFLLNAGANLIVPFNVVFLRFVTLVYGIQGSYFIRNIPNHIDEIYQINLDSFGKSYVPLENFMQQVLVLVDSAQRMQINSSLIKLTLNRAIPTSKIFELMRIKRSGDIFTFTPHYLYLFLFQCERFEIRKVLSHLIELPIEDLFLEQEFFAYVDEIRLEVKEMLNDKPSEFEQAQAKVTPWIKKEKQAERKAATPISLIVKSNAP